MRNSATALAGNSVSQTYPKSLARCTASPEQGGTGGDGKKHSSSVHTEQRQKYIFKKITFYLGFSSQKLGYFLFEKVRARNVN